jgi:hypothetical protein
MPELAQQDCAPTRPLAAGNAYIAWILAAASILVIVCLYFFVFRAAHEVQIREVPLATKEARP